MTLQTLGAADALPQLGGFDAIIDARSEGEFAEDHLPGAVNWPSLNNEERRIVGTLYKQVSPFEAQKRGAAMVAANIARHIEREVMDKPRHWKPLIYCWRGGKRSNSQALVLGQIGFRVTVLEGGYKAFRAAILQDFPARVNGLRLRVICGPTGSGKTRLLQALAAAGAQVLDLEALASHRSSVLGLLPDQPQPTQKRFDTLVWSALRALDPTRPVFVESESKKIGNLTVPAALIDAMRASDCLRLELPDDERVALLLEDYALFIRDAELFCARLDALVELRGKAVVESWKTRARAGQFEPVVRELLTQHYDPGYAGSTRRNFQKFGESKTIAPKDRSTGAMAELALKIVQEAA